MSNGIGVPKWDYHDKNIQGGVAEKNFTRADRTVIYAGPTPTQANSQVSMKAIGLIQGMSHSEQKQLQMIFELGSDAPIIIPGLTQGQLNIQRVLLNGVDLLNAIYHGVDKTNLTNDQILRSIRDVNHPFDLMMAKYPVLEDATQATKAVSTILFRGCQIQSRSESISAGGVVVFEQLNIMYTTIPKVTFNLQ